jgi:hypothetical protein
MKLRPTRPRRARPDRLDVIIFVSNRSAIFSILFGEADPPGELAYKIDRRVAVGQNRQL